MIEARRCGGWCFLHVGNNLFADPHSRVVGSQNTDAWALQHRYLKVGLTGFPKVVEGAASELSGVSKFPSTILSISALG